MTRQNIVGVMLALSAVGIDVWVEIKLDDGGGCWWRCFQREDGSVYG